MKKLGHNKKLGGNEKLSNKQKLGKPRKSRYNKKHAVLFRKLSQDINNKKLFDKERSDNQQPKSTTTKAQTQPKENKQTNTLNKKEIFYEKINLITEKIKPFNIIFSFILNISKVGTPIVGIILTVYLFFTCKLPQNKPPSPTHEVSYNTEANRYELKFKNPNFSTEYIFNGQQHEFRETNPIEIPSSSSVTLKAISYKIINPLKMRECKCNSDTTSISLHLAAPSKPVTTRIIQIAAPRRNGPYTIEVKKKDDTYWYEEVNLISGSIYPF